MFLVSERCYIVNCKYGYFTNDVQPNDFFLVYLGHGHNQFYENNVRNPEKPSNIQYFNVLVYADVDSVLGGFGKTLSSPSL